MFEKIIVSFKLPYVILGISFLILLIGFFQKNNSFFDIRDIFREHNKMIKDKFITFHIVPAMMAISIVMIKPIEKDIISNLNVVMAIILSMFFAMMSIICTFDKNSDIHFVKLKNETFNELILECTIGIIILVLGFIALFIEKFLDFVYLKIISFILYWLVFVLLLNVFVVLKRIKRLFDNQNS